MTPSFGAIAACWLVTITLQNQGQLEAFTTRYKHRTFVFRLLQSWQATDVKGARFLCDPAERDGLGFASL